ncbi:MAG: hypothetical protein LBD25_04560 [Coriobacteriales bacterium]|nr:hypothetical protein [Coriobacteriales bacterium]
MARGDREHCIALMVEKARELGRMPLKRDFAPDEVSDIKQALGPWPRALEQAGLKPVSLAHEESLQRRQARRQDKRLKRRRRHESEWGDS